jgi:predicted O-methyltransferase YrrM
MRKEKTLQQIYLEKLVPTETAEMQMARQQALELGLEGISLSAAEASLVQTLAKSCGFKRPKKCVEIGTLTGLSALYWLQMITEAGTLWSFEKSPEHHARASVVLKKYIDKKQCHLILGDALQMLSSIDGEGPFDFIFIDGNKSAYLNYWNWAAKNCSVGGAIFVDNVFLGGSVYDPAASQRFSEKQIGTVRELNEKAYSNKNFEVTLIPTDEGLLMAKRIL